MKLRSNCSRRSTRCTAAWTAAGLPLNWTNPPTVLTSDAGNTAEFYVSSILFQDAAMTPDQIAGLGSPEDGPIPVNSTEAPSAGPILSASLSNSVVNITWSGNSYVLQLRDLERPHRLYAEPFASDVQLA